MTQNDTLLNRLTIRQATADDAELLTRIEAACFPPSEAADLSRFQARLAEFGEHFWIAELDGIAVGFVNGMVIGKRILDDEMYAKADMHDENGPWQSVFGLDVLPEYRRHGIGRQLLERLIAQARQQGRKGCALACKDHMIDYYARSGFVLIGPSASCHGGAAWNDMVLEF